MIINMPTPQIDNTRVNTSPKPTGEYTHYDPWAPKPGATQDTGTIDIDFSTALQKAIQKYSANYLNSNFANSPFMDVMRWLPGLSYMEKVVTGQPVGENESLSMVMPVKMRNSGKLYEELNKTMTPYRTKSTIYAMRSGDEGEILRALIKDAEKIDAHGISKGSNQTEQLIKILNEGIDPTKPFHTGPLSNPLGVGVGIGTAGGAYTNGRYILTSDPGGKLSDGIKNVLINDYGGNDGYFVKLQEELQKMFPNINFVRYSNAPKYFNNK